MHGTGVVERAFLKSHDTDTKDMQPFHRVDNHCQGDLVGRFLKFESPVSSLLTFDEAAFGQLGEQLPQVGPGNLQLLV